MKIMRRFLGVLVMIAGILGLLLSLTGLVGVWMVKPSVASNLEATILTLKSSVGTSQKAMEITGQALEATVASVDALSTMLVTTATSVEDTQPVLDQLNSFMGASLPATLESATDSLNTAQQAAVVLESAIQSLDTFRVLMSATGLLGPTGDQSPEPYNPEKPLADSLGELAAELEDLPVMFTDMATNMDMADDNLVSIQTSLTTMSTSVSLISASLSEYQVMISESQSSMDNLLGMLTNFQNNLTNILNWVSIGISLFLVWLLATQVVILTQGWELYQGTAGRMEGGTAVVA